MAQYAHKGQILPLTNQMIPIDKQTTFHASYDYHLNGMNQGELVRPIGRFERVADFNNTNPANKISATVNNLPSGASPRTIECWVMITATNTSGSPGIIGYPLSGYSNGATYNIFEINYSTGGNGYFGMHLWGIQMYGTTIVALNTWYHIAATYDGTNVNLYVNGVLESTAAYPLNTTVNSDTYNFNIRRAVNPGDGTPACYLSDVRVWNTARTISQIKDFMNKELAGNEAGLLANFKLNEREGATVLDSSVNGNSGVRQGSVPIYNTTDIVATLKKGEGKFGGAVLIEPDTRNLLLNPMPQGTGTTNVPWNVGLNGNLNTSSWGDGYNGGVPQPAVGYHAHINTSKFGYPVFEYIDENSQFDPTLKHRWLGITQYLSGNVGTSFGWADGTQVTISFDLMTSHPDKGVNLGLYHKLPDGVTNTFAGSGTDFYNTVPNVWVRQSTVWTLTAANWNFTKDAVLYMYGYQNRNDREGRAWIKNVQIETRNGATSLVVGSRPIGKLWYPKEVINPSAFTIGCWFNIPYMHRTDVNSTGIQGNWYHPIIEIATPTSSSESFTLLAGPEPSDWGRKLVLMTPTGITSSFAVQDNTWYHMVATFDGTTYKVYIDGVQQISGAAAPIAPANGEVLMVGGGYRGKAFIKIDELRIESRAISADEAAAWAASGLHYNYLDYSQYVD